MSPDIKPQYEQLAEGILPRLGLSFQDVMIEPAHSDKRSRNGADISTDTTIAPGINLRIPLVSANMDTITQNKMAIGMALEGGIGFIHRFQSAEQQAEEVKQVKGRTRTLEEQPLKTHPDITIIDAQKLLRTHRRGYILLQNAGGDVEGLITPRDLAKSDDPQTNARAVMTPRERFQTVPLGTTLEEAGRIMRQQAVEQIPVINSEGQVVGIYTQKDIEIFRAHPNAVKDSNGRLLVGAAIGLKDENAEVERAHQVVDAGVDVLVLDIAHGDHVMTRNMLHRLKQREGFSVPIIAGNIATKGAAARLIDWGADGLKVGIGPGSVCKTRSVAGVGVPQVTAISDVASVAIKEGIPIMGDGGAREPGDIGKAVVAGADSYMIGGLLAGTEETPGDRISKDGGKFILYRGMASLEAYSAKQAAINQEVESTFVAEGRAKEIPYKGPAAGVLHELVGGLRSTMSYVGAGSLSELRDSAVFIQATPAGASEQLREVQG